MGNGGGVAIEFVWHGDDLGAETLELAAKAFSEVVAPEWEAFAKAQLWPGHGVDTYTLQKSIHMAPGGYEWEKDDVPPSPSAPERGGRSFIPDIIDFVFDVEFGSGQSYAIYVHQGARGREGIPFIANTYEQMAPKTAEIVAEYVRARYGKAV